MGAIVGLLALCWLMTSFVYALVDRPERVYPCDVLIIHRYFDADENCMWADFSNYDNNRTIDLFICVKKKKKDWDKKVEIIKDCMLIESDGEYRWWE